MTDEITAALAPEEWAALLRPSVVDYPDADPEWIAYQLKSNASRYVDYGYSHKAAAICLYGQPFGFSQEDVVALREWAEAIESYHLGEYEYEKAPAEKAKALVLAAKIAALLPPAP